MILNAPQEYSLSQLQSYAIFHVPATRHLMKTAASYAEEQRLLEAAKVLADFANLKPENVERFKTAHPEFFPKAWWEYCPTYPSGESWRSMQWELVQQIVREAWSVQFQTPLLSSLISLTSVFDPDPNNIEWDERPNPNERPPFLTDEFILDLEMYPYHEAIQWLHGQSWRAKICLHCKKYFVAEQSKRQFCTFGTIVEGVEMSCFWAHRKGDKRNWWSKHKEGINKRRKAQYRVEKSKRHASPRLPGSGPKKTAAKTIH